MRILVCGGRDYQDYDRVCRVLDALCPTWIIHGAAKGADSLAAQYAKERGVSVSAFPAAWDDLTGCLPVNVRRNKFGQPYNPAAGHDRNQKMLRDGRPDIVVAFPGGKGTADMVRLSRNIFKQTLVFK